tara:strand:- start:140 stop:292 length:153 start_codon:yes stop_codon:yes gene_type:complete
MKKRTLNELRQSKPYGYKSDPVTRPSILELIKKYPNDTDLGREIRKLWTK